MSHANTFRAAFDCLTLRQAPLALPARQGLDIRKVAVAVAQDGRPAIRDAAIGVQPVASARGTDSEDLGEFAQPFFIGHGFCEDVHARDFNTIVSQADTQKQRQNSVMTKVATRLKDARSQKGWNQAQLAVAAGVSPGTIGNIESGARQAKGSLPQIAKALGISHDWLANGEGAMKGAPSQSAASDPPSPSSQAALLAMLFDRLDNDLVLRAQVFNRASQLIINVIQGIDEPQTPAPAIQTTAKKQSA